VTLGACRNVERGEIEKKSKGELEVKIGSNIDAV